MTLRKSSPDEPGWTRRRHGRGFSYRDERDRPLSQSEVRRIRDLVIPPAWSHVWISPDPDSHLQVVGTDAAGRRQYIYHPEWRVRQDKQKFLRARELGAALGRTRVQVRRHLDSSSRCREWACAAAFRLLDLGCFRIGNDVYADENGSFGLTTLHRRHVRRSNDTMWFEFVGKSGVEHRVSVTDPAVIAALERMRRRRGAGECLLAFREQNTWHELTSGLVNNYIREVTGIEATAKDFRTWHATVRAAASLALTDLADKDSAILDAIRETAALLGNTAAQARASYIDPVVISRYESGRTVGVAVATRAARDPIGGCRPLERAVLRLLREQ